MIPRCTWGNADWPEVRLSVGLGTDCNLGRGKCTSMCAGNSVFQIVVTLIQLKHGALAAKTKNYVFKVNPRHPTSPIVHRLAVIGAQSAPLATSEFRRTTLHMTLIAATSHVFHAGPGGSAWLQPRFVDCVQTTAPISLTFSSTHLAKRDVSPMPHKDSLDPFVCTRKHPHMLFESKQKLLSREPNAGNSEICSSLLFGFCAVNRKGGGKGGNPTSNIDPLSAVIRGYEVHFPEDDKTVCDRVSHACIQCLS